MPKTRNNEKAQRLDEDERLIAACREFLAIERKWRRTHEDEESDRLCHAFYAARR